MTVETVEQIQLIDLSKLEVSPFNPRKVVGDLDELAASIKSAGLFEPLVAVQHNGKFQVIAGSRRLAAARQAKIAALPVRVMDLNEAQARAAALIENMQRKDLEPLEQAEAFSGWLALTGKTQKELAATVGLAPSTVANALRLLEAPKVVQEALRTQTIGAEHARVALSVPAHLASSLTLKKGVTVEQLREEARELVQANDVIQKIKANVLEAREKAKDRADHVVTWGTGEIWAGRKRIKLTEVLGDPPAKIVGPVSGTFYDSGNRSLSGDVAAHDKVCTCRALGVAENDYTGAYQLKRVCVSAAGYRKYLEALTKAQRGKRGQKLPPRQTPAQRAKDKARRERETVEAAQRALSGRSRYNHVDLKVDPRLGKGGLEGEQARLILFAIASKFSSEFVPRWRAALWGKIEKLPIKDVRTRVSAWAATAAISEIRSRNDERQELEELVLGHYGIAVAAPKKKAKR